MKGATISQFAGLDRRLDPCAAAVGDSDKNAPRILQASLAFALETDGAA